MLFEGSVISLWDINPERYERKQSGEDNSLDLNNTRSKTPSVKKSGTDFKI